VQFTVTDVELATATAPIVGAPGTVAGVTAADAADAADVPAAFVAVTVNV
jgi:predicted amino acid dehydrogenase